VDLDGGCSNFLLKFGEKKTTMSFENQCKIGFDYYDKC
jgi:hypothetical protein